MHSSPIVQTFRTDVDVQEVTPTVQHAQFHIHLKTNLCVLYGAVMYQ